VLGVSGSRQANRNGESGYLIPNFSAYSGGAFARQTWVDGAWTIEAGARVDHQWQAAYPRENLSSGPFVRRSDSWTGASGALGFIWRFSHHWSAAANAGRAWRPPGVNERFNFGVHHGTAQFEVGDQTLDREISTNVDATLRHEGDRLSLEVSAFHNRMDGFIYLTPEAAPRVTIRGSFPSFRYAQTDALLTGFDGSVRVGLTPAWTIESTFSVVRGRDESRDEPLILMPSDRLRFGASWRLPDAGSLTDTHLGASVSLVARQSRFPVGVDFVEPPDGYRLVGLDAGTRIQTGTTHVDLSLGVDNLMNTSYRDYLSRFRYFIDNPGRTVIVRLEVPFGSGRNSKP
jgi:iron complex outermembrane receptor protein